MGLSASPYFCPRPQVRNALVSERDRMFSALKEISFLEPYPSHANFILAKVNLAMLAH